jgi:accessory gene regulator B
MLYFFRVIKLIKKCCIQIVNKFSETVPIDETDHEKIVYSLTVIGSELSKFLILLIVSFMFDYMKEFFVAFIFTSSLRVIIGGNHFKTYWGCFTFSSFYFVFLIFINQLTLPFHSIHLIFTLAIIVIFILSPVASKQREGLSKINKNVYKIVGVSLSLFYLAIYLISNDHTAKLGLWTVILQSIELLVMKGVIFYEKTLIKKSYN